ncbi:hypothetical protein GCM10029963_07070 [Micromonospora andamanensis]
MQRDRVAPRVAVEDANLPGVAAQQAEQDPDGRRLARAVGAEETVHLPGSTLRSSPSSARTPPKVLTRFSMAITDMGASRRTGVYRTTALTDGKGWARAVPSGGQDRLRWGP